MLPKGDNNVKVVREEHKPDDRSCKISASWVASASCPAAISKQTNEATVYYDGKLREIDPARFTPQCLEGECVQREVGT